HSYPNAVLVRFEHDFPAVVHYVPKLLNVHDSPLCPFRSTMRHLVSMSDFPAYTPMPCTCGTVRFVRKVPQCRGMAMYVGGIRHIPFTLFTGQGTCCGGLYHVGCYVHYSA